MSRIFALFPLIVSVFLLSGCMKMDVSLDVRAGSGVDQSLILDMSQMATMMSAFSGVSESSSGSVQKDLCKDPSFAQDFMKEGQSGSVTCTSLGDYKAKITGTSSISESHQLLQIGDVFVFDASYSARQSTSSLSQSSSQESGINPKDLGFSINGTISLPGKIAYRESGELVDENTLRIDFLDPKFQKRSSCLIIATPDGKKLSLRDIARYRLLIKKHIRSSR